MFQIFRKGPTLTAGWILGMCLCVALPALAAPPLQSKSATMQCAGRRIVIEADCFSYVGPIMLCTRQSIRFYGNDGKALGARVFKANPSEGIDYPTVSEQFGDLSCVETGTTQKFVVALMDNGGNCDQCEWSDVYSLNGVFVGSTRNGQKLGAELNAALAAAYAGDAKHVLSHQHLKRFYKNTSAR